MKQLLGKTTVLFGMCVLIGSAFGQTASITLLRVSDNNPAYSETVTLTSIAWPAGRFPLRGGIENTPPAGTVSFYEDPLPAQPATPASPGYPTTPGFPATPDYPASPGILLGTATLNHGIAQWSQKFLGGQHKVYAVFNGNTLSAASTSPTMPLNVKPALAIPANGAYLGFQASPKKVGEEAATEAVEVAPPNGVGHTFALHLIYFAWPALSALYNSTTQTFQPNAELANDISHERVPVVSWSCDDTTLVNGAPIQGSDAVIASIGTANPLPGAATEEQAITNAALALAQIPGPVLLRWSYEFNLSDGAHGPCHGDVNHTTDGNLLDPPNNSKGWEQTSYTNFIGAWREIWTLFQQAGATNVVFLWNGGNYNYDTLDYQNPKGFYPGNTFVDWIGLDSYQRKNSAESSGFDTFQDDIGSFYGDFTASQYNNKPLIIGENGSENYTENAPNQELQSAYLNSILSGLETNQYPALKAYDYFDSIGTNGVLDYVLDSEGGLAAFVRLGTNPLFATTSLVASAPSGHAGEGPFVAGMTLPIGGSRLLENLDNSASLALAHTDLPQAANEQVSVPVSLTNNGLLPVTNAQINAITGIEVVAGWGSVTGPSGPISFSTPNLMAGQILSSPVMFTWPPSAVCVRMTVQYSATETTSSQTTYSGQNTITVPRDPLYESCRRDDGFGH